MKDPNCVREVYPLPERVERCPRGDDGGLLEYEVAVVEAGDEKRWVEGDDDEEGRDLEVGGELPRVILVAIEDGNEGGEELFMALLLRTGVVAVGLFVTTTLLAVVLLDRYHP